MSRRMRPERVMGVGATVVNALFVMAAASIAAWALYPVYESVRYLGAASLAIGGGAALAVIGAAARWRTSTITLGALVLYVAGGLSLAIPGATTDLDSMLAAAPELVRGPLVGWKDIVTLPLPLGEYRATLVPAYAMILVATVWATWIAVRSRHRWGGAAVVMAALFAAVITLGPATRAEAYMWAPFGVYVSHEFTIGLAAFVVLIAWFSWRAAWSRKVALAVAHGDGHGRLNRTPRGRAFRGAVAAVAMVVVATVAGTLIAGPIAATTPREVARSAIAPELTVAQAVSPLTTYRTYFTDSRYDAELFHVEPQHGTASRVRIATLPYFDGEVFTASAPSDAPSAAYQRVPSTLETPGGADTVAAAVTIADAPVPWVPTVGYLQGIEFEGPRTAQLVDSFYYQRATAAGVMAGDTPLTSGDTYTLTAAVLPEGALADLGTPPGTGQIVPELIPDSLRTWIANQEVSRDGAGLAELVQRLRERGYLSHSVEADAEASAWIADLQGYSFVGAAAGHSRDRIDRMFTALNEREAQVGEGADNAALVAAVGDDEQFSAAAAMIASEMGFASRVVVGARLAALNGSGDVSTCADGVCRGQDLAAWVEVQGADGHWVSVDVTPQSSTPVSPDISTQTDPEYASPLDPEHADAIVPPASQRGSGDEVDAPVVDDPASDPLALPFVRIVAVSLLGLVFFLLPLLVIVLWKTIRRARRRRRPPVNAIDGAWDEYVDTAIDAGLTPPARATRVETATAIGAGGGIALATISDRAMFSGHDVTRADAEQMWTLVGQERTDLLAQRSWWGRLRMRVSLGSLWHGATEDSQSPGTPSERDRVQWRSDHTSGTSARRRRSGARPRSGQKTEKP